MMKYCLSCRAQIPASSPMCPACGKAVSEPALDNVELDNSGLKSAGIAVGVLLVVLVVGLLLYRQRGASENAAEKVAMAPPPVAQQAAPPQNAQPQPTPVLAAPQASLPPQKINNPDIGTTWTFHGSGAKTILCYKELNGATQMAAGGVAFDGEVVSKFQPLRAGTTLYCLVQTPRGVLLTESNDEGSNFGNAATITTEIQFSNATMSLRTNGALSIRMEGTALETDILYGISPGDRIYTEFVYIEKNNEWVRVGKGKM